MGASTGSQASSSSKYLFRKTLVAGGGALLLPIGLLLCVFITGCGCLLGHAIADRAEDRTMSFDNLDIGLPYSGNTKVAVLVHDQRAKVKSGEEKPTFVGHFRRGRVDISRRLDTRSGRPLAEDFAKSISISLRTRGFASGPLFVSHTDPPQHVMGLARGNGSLVSLVFVINEWESQTNPGVETTTSAQTLVKYDVSLYVVDAHGRSLAAARQFRTEQTVASGDSMRLIEKEMLGVQDIFQSRFRQLLVDPAVLRAIGAR